jgi:hypothetical protein
VTDDPAIAEALSRVGAALERTRAVGRQLIGLQLDDARELATQSGCHLRVVRRDGKGLAVTADLDTSRINVETEDDVVVMSSSGYWAAASTAGVPIVYPRGRTGLGRHGPPRPLDLGCRLDRTRTNGSNETTDQKVGHPVAPGVGLAGTGDQERYRSDGFAARAARFGSRQWRGPARGSRSAGDDLTQRLKRTQPHGSKPCPQLASNAGKPPSPGGISWHFLATVGPAENNR